MTEPPRKNNAGFTLVELSIVLVIIALLIGGILVAQSMIDTAKVLGVVRQISQYDVAVANFQTKYEQLPGDSSLLSGGNNDGMIDTASELNNFWGDLSAGVGLTKPSGQPYGYIGGSCQTNNNCPVFNIKQSSGGITKNPYLYVFWQDFTYSRPDSEPENYYSYDNNYNGIYIKDALALDIKIDDGVAETGSMLTAPIGGGCQDYKNNDSSPDCYFFVILGTTNDTRE